MFAEPRGLLEGAVLVGDPTAVLPMICHLLRVHELEVGLSVPLHPKSVVSR